MAKYQLNNGKKVKNLPSRIRFIETTNAIDWL